MKLPAAIALLALALPALAQRGGARGGSFGSRGFSGPSGFSRPSSFSGSAGSPRPSQPFRYGPSGFAGYRQTGPANYSNRRIPYNAYQTPARRLPNEALFAHPSSAQNRTQIRPSASDRSWSSDPFAARRRSFHNWYANYYPTWPGYAYPYLIDPGFYDWDDSDNSAYLQNDAAPYALAPYPDYGDPAPAEIPPPGAQGPQRAALEPPLTVMFKSGRDPLKMQNYMITAKVLTDLDSRHYEQIPIDQIDLAATQWANSAVGLRFEIPSPSRD